MPFTGKAGDSVYLRDGSGKRHRYVILTAPDINGNIVIIYFTSVKYWKTPSVTFRRRDQRNIFDHETTIDYRYARPVPIDTFITRAGDEPDSDYKICCESVMRRIINGALQSAGIPIDILEEIRLQNPIK